MSHPTHTGSTVTIAGAMLTIAEPAEQALRQIGGASVDDLKWAISLAVGVATATTGVYLHFQERRDRQKIRLQQLDDEARREKALLDMEARIKLTQLARESGISLDARCDGQTAQSPQKP